MRQQDSLYSLTQLLTVVEEGPEQRSEQGSSRGQDGDEGGLEDLVAVEGEIPQEPAPSSRQQSAQLGTWFSHNLWNEKGNAYAVLHCKG